MALVPSLGHALSLQGTPNLYENIALEQQRYKRKKEEDKKKAEKELLDKYRGSLNVTGYDPIYNQKVSSAAAGVVDELNKAQAGKYLNTIESNPEFRKKMADFQILAGNAKLRSQAIAKAEAEASDVANMGKITPNKELFDALNAARTQGEVTPDLEKYFGEGGMGVDPNKFYSAIPAAPFDWRKDWRGYAKPTFKEGKIERDAGDLFITEGGKNFDITANRSQARETVMDPNSAVGRAVLEVAGGDVKKAEDMLYNDLLSQFSSKYEKTMQEKSAGGVNIEEVKTSLNAPQNINYGAGSVPVYGYFSPGKAYNTVMAIPAGAVDVKTGKAIDKPSVDKDVRVGSAGVVPRLKKEIPGYLQKGRTIQDNQHEFLASYFKKNNLNPSDYISYEPISFVSYKSTETVMDDATGLPAINASTGAVVTRDSENSYEVPLSNTKNVYGDAKLTNIYFKDAEKKNANIDETFYQHPKAQEGLKKDVGFKGPSAAKVIDEIQKGDINNYSNVRSAKVGGVETKIGVRNGQWYDINTGKPIK